MLPELRRLMRRGRHNRRGYVLRLFVYHPRNIKYFFLIPWKKKSFGTTVMMVARVAVATIIRNQSGTPYVVRLCNTVASNDVCMYVV